MSENLYVILFTKENNNHGKKNHVVIGVSGGIAAYKACDLVSKLSKKDYEIKVVMTKHAQEFVKPINFESMSKHKCEVSLFDETNEDPIAHITLAKWADIMVLVPATAQYHCQSCSWYCG